MAETVVQMRHRLDEYFRPNSGWRSDAAPSVHEAAEAYRSAVRGTDLDRNPMRPEELLDEVSRLVGTLRQLEKDYDANAAAWLDARARYEEWSLLDRVHGQEVEAGCYRLPKEEAAAELEVLTRSEDRFNKLITEGGAAHRWLNSYLDDTTKNRIVEWRGRIVSEPFHLDNNVQASLRTAGDGVADWEFGVQKQQFLCSKTFWELERDNLRTRLPDARLKARFTELDEGFRQQRREVGQQLALMRWTEHTRPKGPLNYADKMDEIARRYASYLAQAAAVEAVLERGMRAVYGYSLPGTREDDSLEAIETRVIPIRSRLSAYRANELVQMFTLTFAVGTTDRRTQRFTPDTRRPRIIAIDAEHQGSENDLLSIQVTPPGPQSPTVTLGRVTRAGSNALTPAFQRQLQNRAATGEWAIVAPSSRAIKLHVYVAHGVGEA